MNRSNQPAFIPGLDLAEGFVQDLVEPVLHEAFPDLRYTAAIIGSGSEVLGFDTPMSTDHHWGPRVMLFLEPGVFTKAAPAISDRLRSTLPPTYRGYSTHFSEPLAEENGTQLLAEGTAGNIRHRVECDTLRGYLRDYLGFDPTVPIPAATWLATPQQKLRTIVQGRVFRDDLGLEDIRRRLAWYPPDVARYYLASLWSRIGEEEHLHGRPFTVIDGSRIARALLGGITDPEVRSIIRHRAIGNIDLISDSTDLLEDHGRYSGVASLIAGSAGREPRV